MSASTLKVIFSTKYVRKQFKEKSKNYQKKKEGSLSISITAH